MKVEIFSDIACPWCYIGKRRFEEALAAFEHKDDVEITWRSYQLDPSLPEHYDGSELDYLASSKGMPRGQVAVMFEQVKAQAASVGLQYDFDDLVVANSFTAHRFIHLAKQHGKADEAEELLFSGHFEHGKDIGSSDYLTELGAQLELPENQVAELFTSDVFADDVRSDITEARSIGVSGVPFFVFERTYGLSGAQPSETFTKVLAQAWQETQPLKVPSSLDESELNGQVCGSDGC